MRCLCVEISVCKEIKGQDRARDKIPPRFESLLVHCVDVPVFVDETKPLQVNPCRVVSKSTGLGQLFVFLEPFNGSGKWIKDRRRNLGR